MWTITNLTQPAYYPVSVEELHEHLRLNTDAEDGLLAGYIAAATELFEKRTGRAVISRTVRQSVNRFYGSINLMTAPVLSVSRLVTVDPQGIEQEYDGFRSDLVSSPARVWIPASDSAYPDISTDHQPVAFVEFVAGYGSADDVPRLIVQAITLQASDWFAARENTQEVERKPIANGFKAVCDMYALGFRGKWGA